jgi:hypothetical protein
MPWSSEAYFVRFSLKQRIVAMSMKDPEERRKKKQKQAKRHRDYLADRNKWSAESPERLGMLLSLSAPAIEAAGSVQRAFRFGILGCDPETAKELERMVPISRGGQIRHPDADKDWKAVVDEAVKERGIDMDGMREYLRSLPDPN